MWSPRFGPEDGASVSIGVMDNPDVGFECVVALRAESAA